MSVKFKELALEKLDNIGAFLSLACAVECTLLPLLLVVAPFLSLGFGEHEFLHKFVLGFAMTFSFGSCLLGVRRHKQLRLIGLVVAGTGFIIASWWGKLQSDLWVAAGALCLALGHLLNRHFCRTCVRCNISNSKQAGDLR